MAHHQQMTHKILASEHFDEDMQQSTVQDPDLTIATLYSLRQLLQLQASKYTHSDEQNAESSSSAEELIGDFLTVSNMSASLFDYVNNTIYRNADARMEVDEHVSDEEEGENVVHDSVQSVDSECTNCLQLPYGSPSDGFVEGVKMYHKKMYHNKQQQVQILRYEICELLNHLELQIRQKLTSTGKTLDTSTTADFQSEYDEDHVIQSFLTPQTHIGSEDSLDACMCTVGSPPPPSIRSRRRPSRRGWALDPSGGVSKEKQVFYLDYEQDNYSDYINCSTY
eukprot:TRINITY_DN1635_c0_g1_i1.p2 TRINITY_DN1635_c0_g1~~TRINITY_DN1635_c0_g1_i1.p2  ORF type:complete len:281 (+),score=30.64 TRINITY_DN1635_c0_g1_i1:174-1016(+)